MGNQCCKEAEEKSKSSGFIPLHTNNTNTDDENILLSNSSSPHSSANLTNTTNTTPIINNTTSSSGGKGQEIDPISGQILMNTANTRNLNENELKQKQLQLQQQKEFEAEQERQKIQLEKFQKEQQKLKEIITIAGRDMVPLTHRGNGGSMDSLISSMGGGGSHGGTSGIMSGGGGGGDGCYDPGYANLIMQELSVAFMEYNNEQQKLKDKEEYTTTDTNNSSGRISSTQTQGKPIFNQYRTIPETSIIDSRDVMDILCSSRSNSSRQRIEKELEVDLEDEAESFLANVFTTKGSLVKDIGPIVEQVFSD